MPLPEAYVRGELIGVTTELDWIRNDPEAGDTIDPDVLISAYKAGVAATLLAVRYYDDLEAVAQRLVLRAELTAIEFDPDHEPAGLDSSFQELVDSAPSYIPFDRSEFDELGDKAKEKGLKLRKARSDEKQQDLTEKMAIEAFDDNALSAVAGEMGFKYYLHLKDEGVSGEELLYRVKAFELEQYAALQSAKATGEFRQPDQDDLTYYRYIGDLTEAFKPVWRALTTTK